MARFLPRNFFVALALGAFAFTATSGWASLRTAAPAQSAHVTRSAHRQLHRRAKSRTESIRGTIVESGVSCVLRASTGQEYQLSGVGRANRSFLGKTVTVTGQVNTSSHLIDVESIQPQ